MGFPILSHVAPLLLAALLAPWLATLVVRLFLPNWSGFQYDIQLSGPWPQLDDEPGSELPGAAGLVALTCGVRQWSACRGFVVQVGIGRDDAMPVRPWPQYNSGSRPDLGIANVIRCLSLLGVFVNLTTWSVDAGE